MSWAKEYLSELLNLEMYINALKEEYEVILTRATRTTQDLEEVRVQGGGDKSTRDNLSALCAEKSLEIDKEVIRLLMMQEERKEAIQSLGDNRYKTLLRLRYLQARSWEYIAENMGYDLRWVHRLHGQALRAMEELSHVKPL